MFLAVMFLQSLFFRRSPGCDIVFRAALSTVTCCTPGGSSSPKTCPTSIDGSSPAKKARMSTQVPAAGDLLASLKSAKPTLALAPPGKCQFTSEFSSVKLLKRVAVSDTTSILRFAVPDEEKALDLSTCACILAKATIGDEEVVRPYTPISTNAQIGSFDLLIKHYEQGKMSQHMKTINEGESIDFKHIDFNVKIQAPFSQRRIGMIVGGTGITPMIQALHAILGDTSDKAKKIKVDMLYGSKVSSDILGNELLKKWEDMYSDRLSVTHILSDEAEDSDWKGKRGYIDADMIKSHFAAPSEGDEVIIFVCGPPPMYNAICGPREEKEVGGILRKLGYSESQVYKF